MLRMLTFTIIMLVLTSSSDAQDFRQSLKRQLLPQEREAAGSSRQKMTTYFVRADGIPDEHFYVLRGSNLYEVWKGSDNKWASYWAVYTTEKKGDRTRFNITWETGSDEIGDLEGDIYTILRHTTDKSQVGKKHKMGEASLPSAALHTLNNSIKQSIPLDTSKEELKIANGYLDAAEQGFSVKTPHATDARGILHRKLQIMRNLERENARAVLDALN